MATEMHGRVLEWYERHRRATRVAGGLDLMDPDRMSSCSSDVCGHETQTGAKHISRPPYHTLVLQIDHNHTEHTSTKCKDTDLSSLLSCFDCSATVRNII